MNERDRDRTVALAGTYQAAVMAQQLARRGDTDEQSLTASVRSVLVTDAVNVVSVFGGLAGVRLGLESLQEKLTTQGHANDLEVARYVLGLAQLQNRLRRNNAMIRSMASRIEDIKLDLEGGGDGAFSNRTFAELAGLYKETISTLKPRIIVQGEHGHLANPLIVDKVRSALLAGVRAAYLWGQLGGKRWHLIFARQSYLDNANRIVDLMQRQEEAGDIER